MRPAGLPGGTGLPGGITIASLKILKPIDLTMRVNDIVCLQHSSKSAVTAPARLRLTRFPRQAGIHPGSSPGRLAEKR